MVRDNNILTRSTCPGYPGGLILRAMPLDHSSIERQLAGLGEPTTWWERRELRDLPSALNADEEIRAIALGKLQRRGILQREWLIVVTNGRLLCLQTGKRMGRRQLDLHAGQITDVSIRTRVLRAIVIVRAYDGAYRLRVRRSDAVKLVAALSQLMQPRERRAVTNATPTVMVGRVIRHMLALPSAAVGDEPPLIPAPPKIPQDVDARLQLLEDQMQRLQQQMDFIEELLQQRAISYSRPEQPIGEH